MRDEEQQCPKCIEGLPAWMGTFADLMSLLMCFFVLLLSFSEMDVLKFRQIAGSMKFAFGVQRDIKVKDIPKGTSIIAQEFSPGKPTPTAIIEIRQMTTDLLKEHVDFTDSDNESKNEDITEEVEEFEKALAEYIEAELIEIDSLEDEILIRIREKGSFASGYAELQPKFIPALDKMAKILRKVDGSVVVSGHTDNVPINTAEFPSNWVLSSARSANVVHYLTRYGKVPAERIEIRAHADTIPVAKNDSSENKARNRRVEIVVRYNSYTDVDLQEVISITNTEKEA